MRLLRSLPVVFLLSLALCTARAAAHPLGNFTINHLAKITAGSRELRVRYILDIAEIPTFQIMHARGDAAWDAKARQRWADEELGAVRRGFDLRIDGAPSALNAQGAAAELRPGAGGLPILRWVGTYTIAVQPGTHNVHVRDNVYADRRIGWKDIIAGAQTEPTNELRRYPSALIGTPRRIDEARFELSGTQIANVQRFEDAGPALASTTSLVRTSILSDMFSRPDQTPLFVLLTILAAFGLGALHAAEPGHGKALLAFTLVGVRATPKQALILAGSLTIAHTIGVFVLGLILLFASAFVSESVYPAITLFSGTVIAIIGARTLARARHDIAHAHGHDHDHAIPGTKPLGFSSAVWAAMSGGIAPCPAAIVVLLAALRLHHLGYGMLLIVIFSLGLASVLTGLGLLVVRGASWISKRSGYARLAPYAPLVTATVISIVGAVMLAQGLAQEGVAAAVPLLALLVLAAIAGYAFTQHTHAHHHRHAAPEAAST
jgi:ABC-type nickel/cobalt efflux system permease component RcnA